MLLATESGSCNDLNHRKSLGLLGDGTSSCRDVARFLKDKLVCSLRDGEILGWKHEIVLHPG